jgi:hypothetical protein
LCQSTFFSFCAKAQNYAFQVGERIDYAVGYSVIGLYVNAGSASFTTARTPDNNNEIYHLVGEGATNSNTTGYLKYVTVMKVISMPVPCNR